MPGGFVDPALELVRQYGYIAVFVFLFLETSMLFPLLPSEVVVPFAAGVLVADPTGVVLFGAAATAGAVAGSLFAYYAFGEGGNRLAHRVPDRFVDDGDVERARRWFQSYGEWTVCWGRLLPFLRSVISIPAGVARMNRPKFAVYTAVGTFAFNAVVAALVLWGRQHSIYRAAASYLAENSLVTAALLVAGAAVTVLWWRLDVAERVTSWRRGA